MCIAARASDVFTALPEVVPPRGELPDPAEPLSLSLSPSIIEGVNSAVTSTLIKTAKRLKRGPYNYVKLDDVTRASMPVKVEIQWQPG